MSAVSEQERAAEFKEWLNNEVVVFFVEHHRDDLSRTAKLVISEIENGHLLRMGRYISAELDLFINLYISSMMMQNTVLKKQAEKILTNLKPYIENEQKNMPRSTQLIISTHKKHFDEFFESFKKNAENHESSASFIQRLKEKIIELGPN